MTKTLKELGKLKRALEVEIPLEEIQSSYDHVFSHLKTVNLRGFRPGKFPKGWLNKRFNEQMTAEARDRVIPQYFNQIVDEMKLRPATQAVIEELSFEKKKPLNFKLTFEVQPELDLPDYQKLSLEKEEIDIKSEELEEMTEQLRKSRAVFQSKTEGSKAEEGNQVTVDFQRTIDEETTEQQDQRFELNENILPEIKSNILGMKVGENKEFSFTVTEEYIEEHAGKTVTFQLTLKELEEIVLPEMSEEFFQHFDDAKNEEDFRNYVEKQVKEQKDGKIRLSYHDDLRKQLLKCYDEFDLPEQLIEGREKQYEEDLRKSQPDITEEDLETSRNEQMEQYKANLRTEYIIQQIAISESLTPEEEKITQRFASMAQLYGAHPNDFFQSQIGPYFYRQIVQQVSEETVLDFLVDQVLGQPEAKAEEK